MGNVKRIQGVQNLNVTNLARGSYKAAVTVGQIPKPSGIGSRELSRRQLRLADQNTSQRNVLRRNLSAVYPGLEEKTYQLTYCQKFPTLTTRAVHSNEYDRVGGYNYYP